MLSEEPINVTPIIKKQIKKTSFIKNKKHAIPNNNIYVIVVDNINTPCYVKTKNAALEEIFNQAKFLSKKETLSGYRCLLKQPSKNIVEVHGKYINFIISTDSLLHTVTYKKVNLLHKRH